MTLAKPEVLFLFYFYFFGRTEFALRQFSLRSNLRPAAAPSLMGPLLAKAHRPYSSMIPAAEQISRQSWSHKDACTSPIWALPSSSMDTRD